MKSFLKKNWNVIVILVLVVFGLNKCTQSCNRETSIQELSEKLSNKTSQSDSIISALNESIVVLNHELDLLRHDKTSQDVLVATQRDAIEKINEAKKNINVTVKK